MKSHEPRDGYHADNFPQYREQKIESVIARVRTDVEQQFSLNIPHLLSDISRIIKHADDQAQNSQPIKPDSIQILETYLDLIRKYSSRASALAGTSNDTEAHRLRTLYSQFANQMFMAHCVLELNNISNSDVQKLRALLSPLINYFDSLVRDPAESSRIMSISELSLFNQELFELIRNTNTEIPINYDTVFDSGAHLQDKINEILEPYQKQWIVRERERVITDNTLLDQLATKISNCAKLNAMIDSDTISTLREHEQYYFDLYTECRVNPPIQSSAYFNRKDYIEYCVDRFSSLHATALHMNEALSRDNQNCNNSEYARMFIENIGELQARNDIYLNQIQSIASIVTHNELTGADSASVQQRIDVIRRTFDNPSLN